MDTLEYVKNAQDFAAMINKLRLRNKNTWYFWEGNVNNINIRLKGYNKWIQRIEYAGIVDSGSFEKVSEYKDFLYCSACHLSRIEE